MSETLSRFPANRIFVLGGNASFIVSNPEGEEHIFKVQLCAKGKWKGSYFIDALKGNAFVYMGWLKDPHSFIPKVVRTSNSKLSVADKKFKILQWALELLWTETPPPEGYLISAEGTCGACGRILKAEEGVNPEGFRYGFGPVCWERVKHLKDKPRPPKPRAAYTPAQIEEDPSLLTA